MDKQAEILEFGKELLKPRYDKDVSEIASKMESSDLLEGMKKAFDLVCRKACRQQEEGMKEPIAYLNVFSLRSSIITKSYEFLIQAFDDTLYYDDVETMETWTPKWIMEFYEQQVAYFENEVKKNVIRVHQYELLPFERTLAGDYYKIVLVFLIEHLEEVLGLESFQKMKKTEDFQIQYGEYLGESITLFDGVEVIKL
ncbi:MAG: hypothetical protein IKL07_09450 [Clostridium sp.]|nr:hypothetical protein [Clostridium sp.]